MRRILYKDALLSATVLAAGFTVPAAAQDGVAVRGSEAGDIVVTARRVEERLQDVPISITVLNQEQINDRNIITASDLAIYTPSLTSNNRFGSDKSSFTIRGFGQEGKTAPTVGVYFADVVAIRANSGTGGSNGTGPGAFFDLQNVQVLKGPQGTLFGRNTTGGAILLVPQRPTDRLEGYVEGSAGNYDMRRLQAVINLPLAETFQARLGFDHQKRDGYLRNRSGVGPDDFADVNYFAARGSILGQLTPDLENYLIATYSRSNTNGAMFKLGECQRNPALRSGRAVFSAPLACDQIDRQSARGDGYYDVENFYPDPRNTTTQWQVINRTTWTASDALTIRNIVSYGEYRERFYGVIGGEYWILPNGPQAGQAITNTGTAPAPHRYNNAQAAFTEEMQFLGRAANNRLQWQAGAYFELSKPTSGGDTTYSQSFLNCSDVYAFQCFGPAAPFTALAGLGIIYTQIENRNVGFYAQGTYELTDKLALTAGARYTIDKMKGRGGRLQLAFGRPNVITATNCSNPRFVPAPGNLNPAQCDSGPLSSKSSKPTWVIDLEYKPIPDALLYVKYSRGYRQGGVDPSVIALETWQPEKLDTYEVGAKTSFSGTVSGYFNLAAFYNDFTNQQLAATVVGRPNTGIGGARAIVNAGKSRIWGIEADASVTLFDSLRLEAGYAYLNTKLQEFLAPELPANSPYLPPVPLNVGGDLPLSPQHRVTLGANYALPLDESIGRISLGANYVYTDEQVATDQSPFGLLPSSHLLNLNLNWDGAAGLPVDLSAFVTNVTNEKFPVNVANNWASGGYESYILNMPRMYGLRLRYSFGR